MIASNYRKHADAMALQLPLPFGTALTWHTARPGSRVLRAIRAARTAAFKAAGRITYPAKQPVPTWWKEAKARARRLAEQICSACLVLWAEVRVADTDPPRLIAFNLEPYAAPWNYSDLITARKQALEDAHCPHCNSRPLGWSPDWKRGKWQMSCGSCGHTWDEPIPMSGHKGT